VGTKLKQKTGEQQKTTEKFVLAYSGGLDTSVLIKYLQERCNAEVITVTVDVGQGEDLKAAEEKAKKLGVLKHYSIDAKEEFCKDYIFPAIKANALYEGKYPISTSLSRPLIAKKMAATGGYDAVICLGTVIRGATPHFDYISAEVSKGIATVSMETGVPVAFGVLTCDTIEQAVERAGTKSGNKGWDAALTAIEMAQLLKKL